MPPPRAHQTNQTCDRLVRVHLLLLKESDSSTIEAKGRRKESAYSDESVEQGLSLR
jgi:hypothetical protein